MEKNSEADDGAAQSAAAPRWDSTGMRSAYCNLATATATPDSVVVNLGVRQGAAQAAELKAELLHRVLLTPSTARHLHQILGRLLDEHEAQRPGRR